MKRLISSLLVICLFIFLLPSSVFAISDNLPTMPPLEQHEEPFVPSEIGTVQPEPINDNTASNTLMQEIFGANKEEEGKQESPIPDDVWEGTFKDYPCKDGTVTRVYNNNSIYTLYPDGSKEGVDYKGNRYTKDNTGKTICYATDGNQYIQNADGSEEAIATNGTHFYYNEDGTSKGVTTDGFVFEYDAKGNTSAIGIEGGERLSLIDKKGDYITGEHVITGPDGRKFTMVNNENSDGDVTQFKMWFETKDEAHGVDLNMNSDDTSFALSIKDAEGNDVSMSMSEKQNGDGSSISSILMDIKGKDGTWLNITGKGVTDTDGCTDFTLEGSDEKSKFMSANAKSDADGNLTSMTGNFKTDDGEDVTFSMTEDEMSLTSSSGLFMKANQAGVEFYDAKSGDHIKINDKGEPEIFHLTDDEGTTIDYKDGTFTSTDKDGKKSSITIVKDEKTGTVTVTTSEGDTYTVTKDGKVLKNGKELTPDEATPMPTETPTVTEEAKNPAGPDDDGSEDTEKSNDIATPTDTPAPSYAWHRSSTKVEQHEDSKSVAWLEKYTASEGYHTFHDEYIEDDKYDFEGDYIATCSEPPAIIYPNQAFTLNITLESSGNHGNASAWCRTGIPTGSDGGYRTEPKYETADGDSTFTVKCKEGEAHSYDVTVYGKIAEGSKEGELRYVIFTGCGSDTIWIYEWRK